MTLTNPVALKDAVHNVSSSSGASEEYARGIVVGAVSALMATGMDWRMAITQIALNWPEDRYVPRNVLPPTWVDAFRAELLAVTPTTSLHERKWWL